MFVTLLLFPQNDVRTGFAAAHLCTDLSPLTVGSPSAGLKTVSFGRRPKDETVDAGICASASTGRPHHRPAVMVPGHTPLARARVDPSGWLGGGGLMDFGARFWLDVGLGGKEWVSAGCYQWVASNSKTNKVYNIADKT